MQKKLVSALVLRDGRAVCGLRDPAPQRGGDALALAAESARSGADALLLFDQSKGDEAHDAALTLIRQISRQAALPLYGLGNIERTEDVKKILYAGCRKAVLNGAKPSNLAMLEEVSKRFGADRIGVCVDLRSDAPPDPKTAEAVRTYASELVILTDPFLLREKGPEATGLGDMPAIVCVCGGETLSREEELSVLKREQVSGLCDAGIRGGESDLSGLKEALRGEGFQTEAKAAAFTWEMLHPDAAGLIPTVVQDWRTDEVLMVAWMNREAYEMTVRTGRMTYWSRSRQELWIKGETSGHYQYLKEMRIDCDEDTLLCRVEQLGAACHTGHRSCFYREVLSHGENVRGIGPVLEQVFDVIEDRKAHPKEGSYTNYLFDKGIDKILKKCGEEATEIVIAAKNPNPEEIKYEIADFLYHCMVLMSERGVTWEDIAGELANRE